MIHTCPKCEHDIPDDAPRGHCPYCLLSAACDETGCQAEVEGLQFGGRYESLSEISRGGMGRILLARDGRMGRDVALKELLPELRQPDPVRRGSLPIASDTGGSDERFAFEARLTGQLEHPYIVPVYDISTDAATPYYTMRHVRGQPLSDRLDACGNFDERIALLPNFLHVCHAIAYAHSKGIIHRDIKPSNILIGEFGETLVIDWGLAKPVANDEKCSAAGQSAPTLTPRDFGETLAGQYLGSPYYMSPEQIATEASTVDTRSDVFSLGVLLYQLLTGKRPFDGDDLNSIFRQIQNGESIPPRSIEKRIPRELETICLKALAGLPESRYPSARELAVDLERFLGGALVESYSYSLVDRMLRLYRRHKATVLVSTGALAILLAGASISLRQIQSARDDAIAARDLEHAARENSERENYYANLSLALHQIESSSVDEGLKTLARAKSNHRQWEWNYLNRVATQGAQIAKGFSILKTTPNGTLLAGAGPGNPLTFWKLSDLETHSTLPPTESGVSIFEFIENGEVVLTGHDSGEVHAWSLHDLTRRWTVNACQQPVISLVPAGSSRILVASSVGEVSLVDFSDSDARTRPIGRIADPRANERLASDDAVLSVSLYVDPADRYAVGTARRWHDSEGIGTLFNLDSGEMEVLTESASSICLVAESDTIVYISSGSILAQPVFSSAGETQRITSPGETFTSLKISGDGSWLAALSDSGELFGWRSTGLDELPLRLLDANPVIDESHLWAIGSTGFAVSSSDGQFRVFDCEQPGFVRTFGGVTGAIGSIAIDDVRKRLVTGGIDGVVRTWSTENEQPTEVLFKFDSFGSDLVGQQDGSSLLACGNDVSPILIDGDTQRIESLKLDQGPYGGRYASLSPRNGLIAYTYSPTRIRILKLASRAVVGELIGHKENISGVSYSPDGRAVLTTSWDGTARVWDGEGSRELAIFDHAGASVNAARWLDNGARLATGTRTGILSLWSRSSPLAPEVSVLAHRSSILSIAESPESGTLITGSDRGCLRHWDRDSLELLGELRTDGPGIRSLAVTRDGTRLFCGQSDGMISVWDFQNRRELVGLRGHNAAISDLVLDEHEDRLYSICEQGYVRVWNGARYEPDIAR